MANGPISYAVGPNVLGKGVNASLVTDNGTGDPFGRLRVSQPFTQLESKQLYDALPLFWDDAEISGAGTSTAHNANEASTTLTVTTGTAGKRTRQSKQRGYYQPGKGLQVLITGAGFGSSTGIQKSWGYFDDNNGIFFFSDEGTLKVVRRTYVSGAAVDNAVEQSTWNIDKLDGIGTSGVTIDLDKANIYVIDMEWLGVGRVRVGVNVDGVTYYCHEFLNANSLTEVYMQNPNLPIRYEIENDGTGTADLTMDCICASIMSEGGFEENAKTTYISRGGAPLTLGNQDTLTPVLSIRLKSAQLSTRVRVVEVDLMGTTAGLNYEWQLLLNPTVGGTLSASWQDVTNSSLQYDITRDSTNSISGGYAIAGGYGSSSAQVKAAITGAVNSFLGLGAAIDGTPDELVLVAQNIDANNGTIYGGLTLGEYV